jgi:hypothetical protein
MTFGSTDRQTFDSLGPNCGTSSKKDCYSNLEAGADRLTSVGLIITDNRRPRSALKLDEARFLDSTKKGMRLITSLLQL